MTEDESRRDVLQQLLEEAEIVTDTNSEIIYETEVNENEFSGDVPTVTTVNFAEALSSINTTTPASNEGNNTQQPKSFDEFSKQHSASDAEELKALLKSWKVIELSSYFIGQQLFISELRKMPTRVAENLFQFTDIPHGVRVQFLYCWNQWKGGSSGESSRVVPSTFCDIEMTSQSAPSECSMSSRSESVPGRRPLNLITVLKATFTGQTLLKNVEASNVLDKNLRKLLCEAILEYCKSSGHELSVSDCRELTEQIVKVFPEEAASYYFLYRKGKAPTGKLYTMYRNWKASVNRKTKGTAGSRKVSKTATAVPTAESGGEKEHVRIVKHDFSSLSAEDRVIHWKGCSGTRLKDIRTKKHPLDVWPQYKRTDGFRLIEMDFNYAFGEKNELLEGAKSFILAMPVVVDVYKAALDEEDQQLISRLCDNDLTEDVRMLGWAWILPCLVPPSRRCGKGNKKKKKFFDLDEVRNDFIVLVPSAVEYRRKFDERVKVTKSVPPLIHVVGSVEEPQEIILDFDNITYRMESFTRALDIAFKIYYLFNIQYPASAKFLWELINKVFFKLNDKDDDTRHELLELIKKIKDQMNAVF